MHTNVRDIIKYTPASSMIDSYQTAQNEVQEAIRLLKQAKARLSIAFGECHVRILSHNFREYNLDRQARESSEIIRRNAWRGIIAKTQIKKLLTSNRRNQLEDQLERGSLPELDHATLADMLDDLSTNIDQYFQESVKEVFERLRPKNSGHKTNSEFEIGKKVIRYSLIDSRYSTPHLSQYGEEEITSMDNVFHMIDGKGIAKYPDDAVTVIKAAMDDGKMERETDYFHFTWFKNGNLHIVFKRPDLVDELNRMGGGNRLK